MRTFEIQIQGLREAVAEEGESVALDLAANLMGLAGVAAARYDPEARTIVVDVPEFTDPPSGPSFADLSRMVQEFGGARDRELLVTMIHRTPG